MTTKTTRGKPDIRAMFEDAVRRSLNPTPDPAHNTPGIPALTPEEELTVEAGRQAIAVFRKTFDFWMQVACALYVLKQKAEAIGGKKTLDILRTREGLGPDVIHKSRMSRLLTILSRLDEVERWRATLTTQQRLEWASSEAIYKHCPLFKPAPKVVEQGEEMAEPRPSPKAQLANALSEVADLAQLVERLERELASANDEVTHLQKEVTLLRERAQAAEAKLDAITGKRRSKALKTIREGGKNAGRRSNSAADRVPAAPAAGAGDAERKRARRVRRPPAGESAAAAG